MSDIDTRFKSGSITASECGKLGGKRSGESKRRKRQLRDYLQSLLESEDKSGVSNAERIAISLIEKSTIGDVQAAKLVSELTGSLKDYATPFQHCKIKSIKDLPKFLSQILDNVCKGKLSSSDAKALAMIAETHSKIAQIAELEQRIAELERGGKI